MLATALKFKDKNRVSAANKLYSFVAKAAAILDATPVAKSDFGRYALVHRDGGLYLDFDATLFMPAAWALRNAVRASQALLFADRRGGARGEEFGPREAHLEGP